MKADRASMLDAAVAAVADACRVCRAVQADMDVVRAIAKDDKSPVTVADFASQAVVARGLRERLGEVALVGEEGSAHLRDPAHAAELSATLAAARRVWPGATERDVLAAIDAGAGDATGTAFWTLDPVDGTKGFLRRQQYAVSLAYIENGRVVLGVLGCPNLPLDAGAPLDGSRTGAGDEVGCIFTAELDGGALVHGEQGDQARGVRLGCAGGAPAGRPVRLCSSVETAHSDQDQTARVMERLGPSSAIRLDSQAKYAVVARGQADLYLRMPGRSAYVERIWDHAAGSLVAAEAGCRVSDIEGRTLDFSRGRGLEGNRGVLAAIPEVHERVLRAIRELAL